MLKPLQNIRTALINRIGLLDLDIQTLTKDKRYSDLAEVAYHQRGLREALLIVEEEIRVQEWVERGEAERAVSEWQKRYHR